MGVQDLMNTIRKVCPHVLKTNRPEYGTFRNVYFDAPLICVAAYKSAQSNFEHPFDKVYRYLREAAKSAFDIGAQDIHFVFDGETRDEKKRTVSARVCATEKYNEKVACLPFKDLIARELQRSQSIVDLGMTRSYQANSQQERCFPSYPSVLFSTRLFLKEWSCQNPKIHFHVAPHDAEEYIARQVQNRADALTASVDSDVMALGCHSIVQNLGSKSETWIDTSDVVKGLQLTVEQFKWFCVLLGNDFNPRWPHVGPVASLQYVKQPDFTLEGFAEQKKCTEEWVQQARATYKIFSLH